MKSDNIISKFVENARQHKDRVALCYRSGFFRSRFQQVTYDQLLSDVNIAVHNLKKSGFEKNDRILVFVPMSYELYVLCLGILHMGAVLVFVDAWSNKNRLSMACDIVQPKGFIGTLKAQLLRLSASIRQIPIKCISTQLLSTQPHQTINEINPAETTEEDEAIVTFTTGSTGAPKAAKRTHGFLLAQHHALHAHMPIPENDINLATLPIFVLNNLTMKSTTVLPDFNPARPSDFNAKNVVDQIIDLKVTSSIGSPAFFDHLANYILETNTFTSFKTIYTGGAPIFKPMAQKFRQAFPQTDIHVVYGATEVEPVSSIPLDDYIKQDHRFGLPVGKHISSLKVKVIKPSDNALILDDTQRLESLEVNDNEVGEIIVSGDHVLKEYIGSEAMFNQNKIVCNNVLWHRTGDAGRMDTNGHLYLYGRVKNRFLTQDGHPVFSIPIEQAMIQVSKISFAAMFMAQNNLYVALEPEKPLSASEKDDILLEVKKIVKDLQVKEILFMKKFHVIRDIIQRRTLKF
ncbi:MAG: amp-dependent synthetase and ligase [Candidatus Magnetoglobus multicellularis str. Araruama]|uniref:Amp-dependent synthetase and ligase n=1 Tax=Candidatus Magnetoglobus multicellularis str. Araruama TaxID=890399 RepID=A0A1V1P950_9BACT|nr:MAG: amp-dependent synthetase and ligase [Candidatus Magnetoglobus multicellularis str. Araruama]